MQELIWEQAWDKTISAIDRQSYMKLFHAESNQLKRFIPFKEAINHRGDLLISVIVQNFSDETEQWDGVKLLYVEGNQTIAKQVFSNHQLVVPPRKSMPWTFIFPKEVIRKKPQFNGTLNEG